MVASKPRFGLKTRGHPEGATARHVVFAELVAVTLRLCVFLPCLPLMRHHICFSFLLALLRLSP